MPGPPRAKAWSSWRAGLVHRLVERCRAGLEPAADAGPDLEPEVTIPQALLDDPTAVAVTVDESPEGARVTVMSGDRIGLLADAAAMLALQRCRGPRRPGLAPGRLRRLRLGGRRRPPRRLGAAPAAARPSSRAGSTPARVSRRPGAARLEPTVAVRPEASRSATVLEVRMDDRPGVVHLVCAALADLDISVRSAHVSTLGPQAVDVFYVQEATPGRWGGAARAAGRARRPRRAAGRPCQPADDNVRISGFVLFISRG